MIQRTASEAVIVNVSEKFELKCHTAKLMLLSIFDLVEHLLTFVTFIGVLQLHATTKVTEKGLITENSMTCAMQ